MDAAAELGRNPYVSTRFSLSMEMSRLTRDGTAEPVSRDQILRHARGQGNIIFSVQLTTSRIGNLTRLIHTLLYVMTPPPPQKRLVLQLLIVKDSMKDTVRYQGGTHSSRSFSHGTLTLSKETEETIQHVFETVNLPHKSTLILNFHIFVPDKDAALPLKVDKLLQPR